MVLATEMYEASMRSRLHAAGAAVCPMAMPCATPCLWSRAGITLWTSNARPPCCISEHTPALTPRRRVKVAALLASPGGMDGASRCHLLGASFAASMLGSILSSLQPPRSTSGSDSDDLGDACRCEDSGGVREASRDALRQACAHLAASYLESRPCLGAGEPDAAEWVAATLHLLRVDPSLRKSETRSACQAALALLAEEEQVAAEVAQATEPVGQD